MYPDEEERIWKIGEDVVLSNSGYSCVRNLATPKDSTAEIQMNEDLLSNSNGDCYVKSGPISHWFYLLTHGFSGVGADGNCYAFTGVPMDTAAKLIYYCERIHLYGDMDESKLFQATLDAAEIFSASESIVESILAAWRTIGFASVGSMDIGQYGLSYNSNNDGTYYVTNNITIDSAKTLMVMGTLLMRDSISIIVRPGGKLVVDGGILTSTCEDGMWQGIQLGGHRSLVQTAVNQGVLELQNGAVIEHAYNAVSTHIGDDNWNSTGGIIRAQNAQFRNNRRSVEFLSYMSGQNGMYQNNKSYFRDCDFVVDANNHFSGNNVSFSSHVTMWEVKDVLFEGCRFSNNEAGNITFRGRAIFAEDAGFIVRSYCRGDAFSTLDYNCACLEDSAVYSVFVGFSTAIESNTTGSQRAVNIDEATFTNNDMGLRVNGNNYFTLTRSIFNIAVTPKAVGAYIDQCSGYTIEENVFCQTMPGTLRMARGLVVSSSGMSSNVLHRNSFQNLAQGISIEGDNGGKTGGLQCTCGYFSGNNYDVNLVGTATVSPLQGNSSQGADNDFLGTLSSSFYINGLQYVTYYRSLGSGHTPHNPNGLSILLATANPCVSTLCDNSVTPGISMRNGYLSLCNQYDELKETFENSGYADILEQTSNVNLSQQQSARDCQLAINELSSQMYDIAKHNIQHILRDTVLSLNSLTDWYSVMRNGEAKFDLIEASMETGDYVLAGSVMENLDILKKIDKDYVVLMNIKRALSDEMAQVNWFAINEEQLAELQDIAEFGDNRAATMARGLLCFFFGQCIEMEDSNEVGDLRLERAQTMKNDMISTLLIAPNPVTETTEVWIAESDFRICQLEMFSSSGMLIQVLHPNETICQLSMREMKSGIYFVKVIAEDGSTHFGKIVKE